MRRRTFTVAQNPETCSQTRNVACKCRTSQSRLDSPYQGGIIKRPRFDGRVDGLAICKAAFSLALGSRRFSATPYRKHAGDILQAVWDVFCVAQIFFAHRQVLVDDDSIVRSAGAQSIVPASAYDANGLIHPEVDATPSRSSTVNLEIHVDLLRRGAQ